MEIRTFSRVDREINLRNLIVPAGAYWLAYDTQEYVVGNGVDTWESLTKHDYNETIGITPEEAFLNPDFNVVLNGNEDKISLRTQADDNDVLELGEAYYNVTTKLLKIGDGITPVKDLEGINVEFLNGYKVDLENTPLTIPVRNTDGKIKANLEGNADTASRFTNDQIITFTGDVQGLVSFNGGASVDAAIEVLEDSHTHSDASIISINWSKVLDKPSPTITLTGDISGSGTLTDLGDVEINTTIEDNSHHHDDSTLDNINWSKVLNKPSPTITLSGSVSGSGILNELNDVNISVTVANDSHTHDTRYYTKTELDTKFDNKSNVGHLHDDRYYTESEIDAKLANKSNITHLHDDRYYTESEIDAKLADKADTGHTHDDSTLSNINWSKVLNKPSPTITLTGDVSGAGTLTDLGDVTINVAVANNSHTHDDSTITSLDWSKVLNKPSPTITLTGDVSGSGVLSSLGDVTINVVVANDSHTHDTRYVQLTDYEDIDVLNKVKAVDGENSGLDADSVDSKHWIDIKNYIDTAALNFKVNLIMDGSVESSTGYYYVKATPDTIATGTIVTSVSSSQTTVARFITLPIEDITSLLSGMYHLSLTAEKTGGTQNVQLKFYVYEVDQSLNETLLFESNISETIGERQNYIIEAFLSESLQVTPGSRFEIELVAIPSGGGSSPTLTVYYSPTDILSATAPTTIDVLGQHFVNVTDHDNDINDLYNYIDSGLSTKSNVGHTHSTADITDIASANVAYATSAGNAATANKLATARTITLNGDVSGSVDFDGSVDVTISTSVANNSHTHDDSTLSSINWSKVLNKPSPTITLNGDVSGSGTLTSLGDVTISVTVANDSHTHDTRYYTKSTVDNKLDGKSDVGHTHTEADIIDLKSYELASNKGIANGYAALDNNAKVPLSQLPDIAKQQVYVTTSSSNRPSNPLTGDRLYETDTGDSYIYDGSQWLLMADADWANVNLDWTNITNPPATATRWPSWAEVTSKPTTFTPSAHTHSISEITDIGSASVNYASSAGNADTLDGKHASAFILNKGAILGIQAGLESSRPTSTTAGQVWVSTDTQAIYWYDGSSWITVGVGTIASADIDGGDLG